MTLLYDPLQIFVASTTPAGLYARQKWLKEQQRPEWQTDYDSTVALLQSGQLANGSWRHSVSMTVKQLFGLHLTIRHPTPQINNALAHLDLPQAENQLQRAFRYLAKSQRPDGTWGTDQPEWNTFLVVHALKNKNILSMRAMTF